MPEAFRCRACKGPPLPAKPGTPRDAETTANLAKAGVVSWRQFEAFDNSICPHCFGFYAYQHLGVAEGEVDGAKIQPLVDGEVISAHDLIAHAAADSQPAYRPTGIRGMDWVFDGGLPFTGSVLFSGERGTGKSTLLLETLRAVAKQGVNVLYINTEQSGRQLGKQFKRLGKFPVKLDVLIESDYDSIVDCIMHTKAKVVAIDSIQAIELVSDARAKDLAMGSAAAVGQCARDIQRFVTDLNILVFAVAHMNGDGTVSGGERAQHLLDAVLVLRKDTNSTRILSFDGKSRFSTIEHRARFEMGATGLKDLGPLIPKEAHV